MLESVIDISREAGRKIMAHYGSGVSSTKSDDSPLTAADLSANEVIRARLTKKFPTIPILSEESQIPDYAVRKDWMRFWLVDPLDGTKEFLSRNGEFTVNIALIEKGEPVLGVIYAPALNLLYFAASGKGAWKQEAQGAPRRIFSRKANAGEPLVVVTSRSHPSAELEAFLGTLRIRDRAFIGSSLKFCLVAEGKADFYPRFGPTMEWDVAAGECIYRNSCVSGLYPQVISYNKPDLRNGNFVLGL